MTKSGSLVLSIVSLLERLSYYGTRAIFSLFLIDTNALNVPRERYLEYYGTFSMLILLVPIPIGLLVDKYIRQKRAIYLGGFLSLFGYSLLITQNTILTVLSIALILIGTSLVKPSTTILVGRQFKKEDRNRTLAYVLFFLGVNIGAFIGVAGIGYVGEIYSWKWGFIIAAASTLLYLMIFSITKDRISEIETNQISVDNFKVDTRYTLLILPFLCVLNVIYRQSYDIEHIDLIVHISDTDDASIFNVPIVSSLLSGLTSFWTFPLTIGLLLYWKLAGVTDSLKAILFSLIVLILAILTSSLIKINDSEVILEISLIAFALFAIVEILMSSIIVSYLTRIIDINYSNTIYSSYYALVSMVGYAFTFLIISDHQTIQLVSMLTLTIALLVGFRKQIRKLTYGIN